MADEQPEGYEKLYRISSIARMIDVRPITARRYLKEYAVPITETPAGQRVTYSDLQVFFSKFYGKRNDRKVPGQ